jgi:hypothetical protein
MHDNGTESENPIETTGNNTPRKLTDILRWCGEIFTYCILYCRSANRMMDYEASGQGSSPDRKRSVLTPHSSLPSLTHLPFYRLYTVTRSWGLKVTGTWNWPFIYRIAVLENACIFSSTVFLLLNNVLLNCSHYCDTFK